MAQGMPDGQITPSDQRDWFIVQEDLFQEKLAGVPGSRFDKKGQRLIHRTHLPLLNLTCKVVEGVEFSRKRFNDTCVGWKLRPYQHEARDFILSRRGTLLADQMRLGKTAECIAAHDPNDGALVVCAPLSTRIVWVNWMAKRWPNEKPIILQGRTMDVARLKDAKLVFLHYELLQYWQSIGFFDVGTVVFDEAHKLTNHKTFRSQSAMLLAGQAKRLIYATGTPLWNRPKGLYTLLETLNPGAWGNFQRFAHRYCDGRMGAFGFEADGTSHEDELKTRLKEVMIRRTWADVSDQVPDTQRSVELVDLDTDAMIRMDKLSFAARGSTERFISIGEIARIRRLLGGLKWKRAAELALDVIEGGEPVVVWAWHKELAVKIAVEIEACHEDAFLITGELSPWQRDYVLENWRKEQRAALVITMGVGQVGIDLKHARHCIFAEEDWTPAVVAQAEARTFDVSRPMTSTYVVANHPVDLMVVRALMKKARAAEKLGVPAAETAIDMLAQAMESISPNEDMNFDFMIEDDD